MSSPYNNQELRDKVKCVLGYCEVSHQGTCLYESSRNATQELDLVMRLLLEDKERVVDESEIEALGHIIPNFDGVGGIGYQYEDGSRVSVETRIEQLEASLKEKTE